MAVAGAEGASAARVWLWTTVALTAGALIVAAVVAPPAPARPIQGLEWLLFLGSSVHVAATGWLATIPDIRRYALEHQGRYVWAPVVLVVGAAAAAVVAQPATMAWLLLPYFAWQFLHFQKQNLGMAALAASSRRVAPLGRVERRALLAAGWAGTAGVVAHPQLLQIGLPFGLDVVFLAAALLFTGAVGTGLVALARRPAAARPPGLCAVYSVALLFPLPVFIFSSPYAAVGGMTVAHGFQYLVLVGMVAAGEAAPGARRLSGLALLAIIALTGGMLLSTASHLHSAVPALRLLFGAYLGVVMSHFVVDAGLWRLRDPFPRAFMARRVPYLVPPVAIGRRPI